MKVRNETMRVESPTDIAAFDEMTKDWTEESIGNILDDVHIRSKLPFILSVSRKDVLTIRKLENEIREQIDLHQGRVSIQKLQRILDVEHSAIENYIFTLVASSKQQNENSGIQKHFSIINGGEEVVTSDYINTITKKIDFDLNTIGTLLISDLAGDYNLSVEYMKDAVLSRLQPHFHKNSIHSHTYLEKQSAIIRGMFCASSRPLQIPNVARLCCLDESFVLEYVHELIESQRLQGVLRGREYLPYVFLEIQQNQIFSFFQDNQFIEHARANQMKVYRPFDFIRQQYPHAIELENVIVSETLFLKVEGAIELAIQERFFVDVRMVLPSALETADCTLLLKKSPLADSDSGHSVVISDVFVVSQEFLKSFESYLKADANEKAKKATSRNGVKTFYQSAAKDSENFTESDVKDCTKKGQRSKGRGSEMGKNERGSRGRKHQTEDKSKEHIDLTSEVPSGKKGKRSSKRNDRNPSDTLRKQSALSITPMSIEVHSLLRAWDPRLEDEDEELLGGLFDHFSPYISRTYHESLEKALQSNFRGDAAALRSIRKAFEDRLDDVYSLLLNFESGLHKIQVCAEESMEAAKALKAIRDHLSRSVSLKLCFMITRFIATEHELDLEAIPRFASSDLEKQDSIQPPAKLSDHNKKLLEENLEQAVAHCIFEIWSLATGPLYNDFMVHIPLVMNVLNIPMRKLDRKKKRQIIFNYRHKVIAQLETYIQTDSIHIAQTVALVLQLFFQKCTGLIVALPNQETTYALPIVKCFRSAVGAHVIKEMDAFLLLVDELSQSDSIIEEKINIWKEALSRVKNVCMEKDAEIQ